MLKLTKINVLPYKEMVSLVLTTVDFLLCLALVFTVSNFKKIIL